MKIDFAVVLKDLQDKEMRVQEAVDSPPEPMTLGIICTQALLQANPEDRDGEAKAAAFKLAVKLQGKGPIDITPEEATQLKNKVGAAFPPLVVGRAFELLNG